VHYEARNCVFRDFLRAQVAFSRVFCTLKIVSGEGCEGKIPEKISSVPLTEIYRLSYLTLNSVHRKACNRVFCDIFARLSRVFRTLNVVSGEGYEGKILKKIPRVFSLRPIDRAIKR